MSENLRLRTPKDITHIIGLSSGEIRSFADQGCRFYGELTCVAWVREFIQKVVDGILPYVPYKEGGLVRKAIPLEVRQFVIEREGNACHYCGAKGRMSMDHIVLHSKGGPDTEENLVAACLPCNIRRGTRSYDEFRESVRSCVWPRITNADFQRVEEITMEQLQEAVKRINIP